MKLWNAVGPEVYHPQTASIVVRSYLPLLVLSLVVDLVGNLWDGYRSQDHLVYTLLNNYTISKAF